MRYRIGVDEVGRGPLAGPVAVGVVRVAAGFNWSRIPGVRDSKKMTPKAREAVYAQLRILAREGSIAYVVAFSSAAMIDRIGIVPAIRKAILSAFSRLDSLPGECEVLLDGGLKAPDAYTCQTTIIRGDDTEPVISLASIAAKVERDRRMVLMSKKHPGYDFEVHKGYGTKAHYAAIRKCGISPEHRRSFL